MMRADIPNRNLIEIKDQRLLNLWLDRLEWCFLKYLYFDSKDRTRSIGEWSRWQWLPLLNFGVVEGLCLGCPSSCTILCLWYLIFSYRDNLPSITGKLSCISVLSARWTFDVCCKKEGDVSRRAFIRPARPANLNIWRKSPSDNKLPNKSEVKQSIDTALHLHLWSSWRTYAGDRNDFLLWSKHQFNRSF